jgi:hypothetical protein
MTESMALMAALTNFLITSFAGFCFAAIRILFNTLTDKERTR